MTKTNSSASSKSNTNMIVAAIVVVIIIVVGVALVVGSNSHSHASNTPTSVAATTAPTTVASGSGSGSSGGSTAATTAPSTTVSSSGSLGSFQDWAGQNLTIAQFSQYMSNYTATQTTMLNATYNFISQVHFTGQYSFSENSTGTTLVQKYYNSSRIVTTSNSTYGSFSSTEIYNASSHTGYICTTDPINGSVTCMVSNYVGSIVNSTGILGSEGSNVTLSGYFNNIKVTSTSYNGQPCTLVTGNLYLKAVTKTSPVATSVIQGTTSACTSTQYHAWLNQSLTGTISITENGTTTNANISFAEGETHISNSASAAITALPGPVVS